MKEINLSLLGFLLIFVSGCSSKTLIHPVRDNISIPTINSVSSAELGDTLLDKGFTSTYPAVQTLSVGQGNYGVNKFTLKSGLYYAKEQDSKYTYYYPVNRGLINSNSWSGDGTYGFLLGYALPLSSTHGELLLWYEVLGTGIRSTTKTKRSVDFEHAKAQAIGEPSFRQQFIYNGKIGNNLKFLYRELSNNYARAPFSQEIQYDLNESKIIGFKGVRIEIIEATNQKIKYKTISNFSD